MKRWISVLSLAAAIPLFAEDHLMKATIPFDFTVGVKTLQAGDYQVSRDTLSGVLLVRSADLKTAMAITSIPASANQVSEHGRLVFRCVDGRYFLSQVWEAGSDRGRELPPGKAERELLRAGGIPSRAHIVVALR